jgi:hypothetical protein
MRRNWTKSLRQKTFDDFSGQNRATGLLFQRNPSSRIWNLSSPPCYWDELVRFRYEATKTWCEL